MADTTSTQTGQGQHNQVWAIATIVVPVAVTTAGAMLLLPTLVWLWLVGIFFFVMPIISWNERSLAGRHLSLGKKGRALSLLLCLILLVLAFYLSVMAIPLGIATTANDQIISANVFALLGVICITMSLVEYISLPNAHAEVTLPRKLRYSLVALGGLLLVLGMCVFLGIVRVTTPSTPTVAPTSAATSMPTHTPYLSPVPTAIDTVTASATLHARIAVPTATPDDQKVTVVLDTPSPTRAPDVPSSPVLETPTWGMVSITPSLQPTSAPSETQMPELTPSVLVTPPAQSPSPEASPSHAQDPTPTLPHDMILANAIVTFTNVTFYQYWNPSYQLNPFVSLGDVSIVSWASPQDTFARPWPTAEPNEVIPRANPGEKYQMQSSVSSTKLNNEQNLRIQSEAGFIRDVGHQPTNVGRIDIVYTLEEDWGRGTHLVNSLTQEQNGSGNPSPCPAEPPGSTRSDIQGCFELEYEIEIIPES